MIPTPRPDWALGSVDTVVAYTVFGLAFVVAVVYAGREAFFERRLWPVFLLLAACVAVVYEPIVNVLGLCTYPEIGQLTWIDALGRRIPVYIGLVYVVYWSAPVLWLMNRIRAGINSRQWWAIYALFTIVVTLFELIPLQRGWWSYYGVQQPLLVAKFPAWWWVVNSAAIFGLATVFSLLRDRMLANGRTAWVIIPLLPMVLLAVHGGPGIPVFLSVGTTTDPLITNVAALVSIALALISVWFFGYLVCQDRCAVAAPPAEPESDEGRQKAFAARRDQPATTQSYLSGDQPDPPG